MKGFKALLLVAFLTIGLSGYSQPCGETATMCEKHIGTGFLSDGQAYRALLIKDQIAEFHTTFYGGTTYRVAACSGQQDRNLVFRVYDQDHNLLFSNNGVNNAPYWDFKIQSTMDCIIEAQLDPKAGSSGCAVLLVGFKKP